MERMDFTIDPNEPAGLAALRGVIIRRGASMGGWILPPDFNLPPVTMGELVEPGESAVILPLLRASQRTVERVLRLDAQRAGIPTRATTEETDNVLAGPHNAPTWDVVEETARLVHHIEVDGYDLAGVRILTAAPDLLRLTVCHWLPTGRAAAVGIQETVAVNFPELQEAVDAHKRKLEPPTQPETFTQPPALHGEQGATPTQPETLSGESAATRVAPPSKPAGAVEAVKQKPAWVPKRAKTLEQWGRAYRIISDMRTEAADPGNWQADSLPALEDYRERLSQGMNWKPSTKTVGRIQVAGDSVWLPKRKRQ